MLPNNFFPSYFSTDCSNSKDMSHFPLLHQMFNKSFSAIPILLILRLGLRLLQLKEQTHIQISDIKIFYIKFLLINSNSYFL